MSNNGGGRKPRPFHLVDNSTRHLTQEEQTTREDNTPKGCSAKLKMPSGLSKEAQREWHRVIKLYRELDSEVINDLDVSVLMAYCEAVSIYKEAQRKQAEGLHPVAGLVDGKIVQSPYITVMDRQIKNIIRLAEQLCMSPVGRARLGMAREKEADNDPMGLLLNRGKPKVNVQQ